MSLVGENLIPNYFTRGVGENKRGLPRDLEAQQQARRLRAKHAEQVTPSPHEFDSFALDIQLKFAVVTKKGKLQLHIRPPHHVL